MDFKKQKPIYQQIADTLCERIVSGELKADERMLSVRDVAIQLGVNPNTVMRTFEHLQNAEIIYNKRGVGYFVSPDASDKILALHRKEFMEEELPAFLQKMKMLGLTLDDLKQYE
ncbi:MAG: GntR family transcriptional regulator [Bacteroidales bacterium]|nr:GntR family transcriptional regulator [Bacteroidales bacterium]